MLSNIDKANPVMSNKNPIICVAISLLRTRVCAIGLVSLRVRKFAGIKRMLAKPMKQKPKPMRKLE